MTNGFTERVEALRARVADGRPLSDEEFAEGVQLLRDLYATAQDLDQKLARFEAPEELR